MSCPARGLRFGTLLPVMAILAVTGFFMPVGADGVGEPSSYQPSQMWTAGPAAPAAALPAQPVLAAASGLLDLPRAPRSVWYRWRVQRDRLSTSGIIHPRRVRSPVARTASAGPAGRERLESVGRLTSPSTAPPFLRTPGA